MPRKTLTLARRLAALARNRRHTSNEVDVGHRQATDSADLPVRRARKNPV